MIRKFINFLGIATSVAILASCSGATESLEDNQVETKQETAVEENNNASLLARFVAENEIATRLSEDETLWTTDSKVTDLYPIYIAGVDGVAYYECKVETNGEDAGYVLVSVTKNDILIPETAEEGKTLTEQYAKVLGTENFNVLRYDYFSSSAESSDVSRSGNSGILLATKGFFDGNICVAETSRSSSSDWYYDYKDNFGKKVIENGAVPQYTKEAMDVFYKDVNFTISRGGSKVEVPYIKGGTHYKLNNKFCHGYSTPRWAQYDLDDGYPAGCGSTAWTILYAYWHQFKGKNKLFIDESSDSLDLNYDGIREADIDDFGKEIIRYYPFYTSYAGSQTKSIVGAMDLITNYCDGKQCYDINGNKARMILPYTNPGMNTGIKYAQDKGYSASVSCKTLWADWQGATDNIINEIKNDRPVILYFDGKNFEGKYFKYHYAVITGVKEHYWTNTDVTTQLRLDVNNGWGTDDDNYKKIYAFTHDVNVTATNCFDYYTVNIK